MTTVTPAATTPPASGPAGSNNPTDALSQLSGNFDTFLKLLTTQLQNQDPMSPMDSNQFTQELVEFSGVEQQINTNDNLKTLIALAQGNSTANAVSYLGKTVTITNGDAPLQNGAANWTYALGAASTSTTLTITDSTGKVVFSGPGETAAGQHAFSWNGEDNNGNTLPDGTYKLAVTATAADGSAIDSAVATTGVVSEVDLSNSEPMLLIGNMEVPVSAVTAVLGS